MNPVLVEVYRGGVLESFHRGVICVVDRDGNVIYSEGDISQVCYPRSAMKFIQVLPLIESGGIKKFGFTLEEIAIMCGSHNAEEDHVRVVNSILLKIGLDKNNLCCGPQIPTSKQAADVLIQKNEKPHHIHNNCSGKHAGMLALCKLLEVSTDDYLNPDHPVQQLILNYVEEMYEFPRQNMTTALDGCSAPVYSMPVYNQAVGYKNMVYPDKFGDARKKACDIVIDAVTSFPFMVAGSKRYCTDMLTICGKRMIGKTGAEGVFSLGLREEKMGVSIKIDDGKMLPQYNVAQAFIEATTIFSKEQLQPLHHYKMEALRNLNDFVTGEIRTNEHLFKGFSITKSSFVIH